MTVMAMSNMVYMLMYELYMEGTLYCWEMFVINKQTSLCGLVGLAGF